MVAPGTNEKQVERTTMPVSLPKDTLAWIDWFLEEHGTELDYRNRIDFILNAIRCQKERDVERLMRLRTLEQADQDALDWESRQKRSK